MNPKYKVGDKVTYNKVNPFLNSLFTSKGGLTVDDVIVEHIPEHFSDTAEPLYHCVSSAGTGYTFSESSIELMF